MNIKRVAIVLASFVVSSCGGCGDDESPEVPGTLLVEQCDNGEDDDGDGLTDCEARECQLQTICVEVPVEPSPPAVSGGGIPAFADTVRFLWEGEDAVIFNVDPAALSEDRLAVIRGRVLNTDGEPVAGVHASIAGRPDFGYTYSREDGAIDLVANGGREVVVRWESAEHPAVDRRIDAPVLDFAHPEPVVMTSYDDAASSIDLTRGGTHEATIAEDSDGERSMRLYFPPGTLARVVEPDGTVTTLDEVTVRATEFTVGATGALAMPAGLPDTSAYTYAVELSVDEARAVGAQTVEFTRPVSMFLDNFLDLPVGVPVPNGLYDRSRAMWEAAANGVVARRVGDGIDLDGDDAADADEELAAFGHDPAGSRTAAAEFFEDGQTFWLAAVPHFTPSDLNYPFEWPDGAVDPDVFLWVAEPRGQCEVSGSTIECQNQVLEKTVDLPGTNLDLTYRSDRVVGRGRGFDLRLTGDSPGPDIEYITVTVELAGRRFEERFDPASNLTYEFRWNGLDAYGRNINGRRTARVNVAYWYDVNYTWPPEELEAFGSLGDGELAEGRLILPRRARLNVVLGGPDARAAFGLGGWQLSAQPGWDANTRTLYPAADPERDSADVGMLVHNLETFDDSGGLDFDPREERRGPQIDVLRDGTVLALFREPRHQLWRRSPAGEWSKVSDLIGVNTAARVDFAVHPDGEIFLTGRRCVYRILDADAEEVAGNCVDEDALPPRFPADMRISISPNGRVFVSDFDDIFEVHPDTQRVEHFAGCGGCDRTPEIGDTVRDADLGGADLIAAARDGIYYTSFDDHEIRFVDWAGRFDVRYVSADADFLIKLLKLDHEGDLHFVELESVEGVLIKRLQPDGSAATIVGGTVEDVLAGGDLEAARVADGVPSSGALLSNIYGFGFDGGGTLHYSTFGPLPDNETLAPLIKVLSDGYYSLRTDDEVLVPSESGHALHVFDTRGRILRTLHALTGAPIYEFEYEDGALAAVRDPDVGRLVVERDSDGVPVAMTSPGGARTTLAVAGDGHVESIEYPDERTITISSTDGLLTDWQIDNHETSYTYDAAGRLTRMEDGSGGWKELTGSATGVRYETSAGTVREWGQGVVRTRHGTDWLIESSPVTRYRRVMRSDGTVVTSSETADPRLGPQSLFPAERVMETPSGVRNEVTASRSYTYPDEDDRGTVQTRTDRLSVNGSTTELQWDVDARTLTATSPEGRTSTTVFDDQGRPLERSVPGYAPVSWQWYDDDQPIRVEQADRWIAFDRDSNGYVVASANAAAESVTYTNDPMGRTLTATYNGQTWMSSYDDAGRLNSTAGPMETPEISVEWDHRSRLSQHGVPGAGDLEFEWNIDDAMTAVTKPGGETSVAEFDDLGRPVGVSSADYNVVRDWNPDTGQVDRVSTGETSIELEWDGFLLRSSRHVFGPADVTVEHTRDDNFYVTRQYIGSVDVEFEHDGDGLRTSAGGMTITRGDAGEVLETEIGVVRHTREYDDYGWPVAERYVAGGTTVYAWDVQYDLAGRISSVVEEIDGTTTSTTFTYDAIGRLIDVEVDGAPSEQYEWSGASQRTLANGAISEFDGFGRLALHGGTSLTYDADGNVETMTGAETTSWSYGVHGRVSSVAGAFGDVGFIHDGLGKRVGMTRDGVFERGWVYDGDDLVAQVDAQGAVELVFVYAAHQTVPNLAISSAAAYRLITDWRGSVRAVVDTATGAVVQRRDYDAFGVATAETGVDVQPFAYAGGLDIGLTGLWAFAARVHVPALGRWLQPDPAGLGGGHIDLWSYVAGDPVNYVDRLGESLWPAIIGVGIAGVGSLVGLDWAFNHALPLANRAKDHALDQFQARQGHRYPNSCIGGHNGPGDAVKHCSLSCELTRANPTPLARLAQKGNEWAGAALGKLADEPIPWDEHVTDHKNNDCGTRLAEEHPETPCYDLCERAFFRGELFVLPINQWYDCTPK